MNFILNFVEDYLHPRSSSVEGDIIAMFPNPPCAQDNHGVETFATFLLHLMMRLSPPIHENSIISIWSKSTQSKISHDP
uniref:Uncharacterized protein n=1 Tax=Arundo donax TaxID=35708 RepID=A0A0A9APF0_ARUDO